MKTVQYLSVLENASFGFGSFDILHQIDSDSRYFQWFEINNTLEAMIGIPRENLLGQTLTAIIPESPASNFEWDLLGNELSSPTDGIPRNIFHQKTHCWYNIEVIYSDKTTVHLICRDITSERRQLEDYEKFFNVNLDLLCIANIKGEFLKINKEWESKLGFTVEELYELNYMDLIHPDDIVATNEALKTLSSQKEILNFTNRYRCKDGTYRYIEWRSLPSGDVIIASARDITARIITEQELSETKRFLEQTARMAKVGAWEVNFIQQTVLWSEVTKEIHEVAPTYIPNLESGINFYKEGYNRDRIQYLVNRAKTSGEAFDEELELITALGNEKWVRVIGQPEFIENECVRLSGVFQDINEKKFATEGFNKARLMLESILSEIEDVVWSIKLPAHETLFVTPSVEKLYGVPMIDWMENTSLWEKAIHPDDKQVILAIKESLNSRGNYEYSYRILDKTGKTKWVLNRGKVILDKNGVPQRIDGVLADITEAKKAEMELLFLTDLQRILVDMALKYINIPLSKVQESLQESLQRLGEFTKADRVYVFKYDWEHEICINTHEWCASGIIPQIDALQEVPLYLLEDWTIEHKKGKEYYLYDILSLPEESTLRQILESQEIKSILTLPLMNEADCLGFVGFDFVKEAYTYSESEKTLLSFFAQLLVNIELRNRILQELINERERAESASKFKSEFLANMSHEIRTPLNGVIGFTDLLLNTPLNSLQQQYAENANISGKSLLGIINDILDFSKIEAGKLDLEIIETDIVELLEHSVDIIKFHASQRGLELLLNIPPETPTIAQLDPIRLKQILINLLTNAVKFTEKGEVELKISHTPLEGDQAKLKFTVKDTGIGISKVNQAKLFKAFSQADSSTTRKFGGTGLGLSISNLLVEKMGGKLELTSEPGVGSEFYFTIETTTTHTAKTKESPIPIKHVLVIDDNEKNRLILEHNFRHWNISFTGCENGYEGLRLIQHTPYDLLIIDYHMPVMDGLETIKIIRKKLGISAKVLPIILLHSSVDEIKVRKSCAELQVKFNLVKPVKARELLQFINNIHLSTSTSSQQNDPKNTHITIANRTNKVILVAEDVPMNMMLIKTYLGKMIPDSRIIEAVNGKLALEAYTATEKIDLIFMDVQMPEMDGIATTKMIRELEIKKKVKTPIIALTAGALREEKEKCLESGMDEFLSKPLKKEALEAVLDKYLEKTLSSENFLSELKAEFIDDPIFDKKSLVSSLSGDPKIYEQMLVYSLQLEEQFTNLEMDIHLNKRDRLLKNLEPVLEVTKTMFFLRLSRWVEKITVLYLAPSDVLVALNNQILSEWTETKAIVQQELNNLRSTGQINETV